MAWCPFKKKYRDNSLLTVIKFTQH